MTTSRTVRGNYLFKVSERQGGTPWISLETRTAPAEFSGILVGFDLKPGTDIRQAEEVALYLNQHLGDLQITFFDSARITR